MSDLKAKNTAPSVEVKQFAESSIDFANRTQTPAQRIKIAFFGTPLFAKNILESFVANPTFEIVALITQKDKPFGRKQMLKMPETKAFALERNLKIPIFQPQKVSDILGDLRALKPDIALVVAFGKMLPKSIIDEFCCINIHASILPKFRGASPINAMILSDEKFLGVTLIKMDEGLDSGDILGFSYVKNLCFDAQKAGEILSQMGAKLAIKILPNLAKIAPLKQIGAESSKCGKIAKEDGIIAFKDAKALFLKSLAYKIYPQIALENGTKLFDIALNEVDSTNECGEILAVEKDCIIVGCARGSVKIGALQKVGKNKVSAVDYLNGARLKVGAILR